MRNLLLVAFCLIGVVLSQCAPAPSQPEGGPADRVLLNGNVLTVDSRDFVAEAIAIRDGKIVAVGSGEHVRSFIGPDTQEIDLKGATVTPGLLDSHCHFQGGGIDLEYELDLSYPNIESVVGAVEKVQEQVAALGDNAWITGRGWDEGKLTENRYIYAADLDSVSPKNPVWLTHTMGHYGVANSEAMKMANITRDTPDPPGGTIDRDEKGNPTGVLKESAQRLVRNLVPNVTLEQREKGLRRIVREFNAEGMTGLKEPGINQTAWQAYQNVLESGDLSVRVFALWRPGRTLEAAQELLDRVGTMTRDHISTGEDHLISGGIKLAIDGSGGARTAWLHEDWNKNATDVDKGNVGYPVLDPEVLRKTILLFHDAGLHVSVHSIGDQGIDWVVDSFEMALEQKPTKGLRHGIIHMNIPSDQAIQKTARMQREFDAGYPEPSATFMWWIGDTYAGNFGPERATRLNPFKKFVDNGMIWANGSDFGVTPFQARYGLWSTVARETLLGVYGKNPWGMDESVDIRTALKSMTIWTAHQMFLEDKIGSIEPGKYADLAVWDRDFYSIPTSEIKDAKCLLTLFEGRIVHQAQESPLEIP